MSLSDDAYLETQTRFERIRTASIFELAMADRAIRDHLTWDQYLRAREYIRHRLADILEAAPPGTPALTEVELRAAVSRCM